MIYGFISSLDDETTKVFFRSKKIRGNNIYNAGSLGALTSVLQSGDVVYTVSCNRFICLEKEHEELIDIMDECYDVKLDELDIVEDIMHWYPLFYFPNGDAFCLDIRNGTVVFYEHEIYEGEKNLHGLLIATSINDLYEKWSGFHFKDVYDWSEVVNEEGIDLSCEVIRKYL